MANRDQPKRTEPRQLEDPKATFYMDEKTALMIDGPNLYACLKSLGLEVDFRKLLGFFQRQCRLARALYYTTISEDQEFDTVRPLVDWLQYNGFTVITKPKKQFTDAAGRRITRGNMDVELTVDAIRLARHLDHLVLFTGNGDFRALVECVQQMGKRVTIVSSLVSDPPMVADDLRRQADQFIELADLGQRLSLEH